MYNTCHTNNQAAQTAPLSGIPTAASSMIDQISILEDSITSLSSALRPVSYTGGETVEGKPTRDASSCHVLANIENGVDRIRSANMRIREIIELLAL